MLTGVLVLNKTAAKVANFHAFLAGWLAGWLARKFGALWQPVATVWDALRNLASWLGGWLAGWMAGWLAGWLVGWLAER